MIPDHRPPDPDPELPDLSDKALPDGGTGHPARDLVGAALAALAKAGTLSLSAAGDAVEAPARALAVKVAEAAVNAPRPVAGTGSLVAALGDQPRSPLLGGATGAALAARVARRVGPLRFLARRTPMWMVATAVPALHASITRGAEELSLVASHLVLRAREAGVEPDPDRVRRAAVQVVSGAGVDPDVEPRYAPMSVGWIRRAARATLPFAPGVATKEPASLARAAAAVDPSILSRRPPGVG